MQVDEFINMDGDSLRSYGTIGNFVENEMTSSCYGEGRGPQFRLKKPQGQSMVALSRYRRLEGSAGR